MYKRKYIEIEGYAGGLGAARVFNAHKDRFRADCYTDLDGDSMLPVITDGIIAEINRKCAEVKSGYHLFLRRIPMEQLTIELAELEACSPYDWPCRAKVILTDTETPRSCGYTTEELRKVLIRES